MKALLASIVAIVALLGGARAQERTSCDISGILLFTDYQLDKVSAAVRKKRRLDVTVVGTGSSRLSGPDGASISYPARFEQALRRRLPGIEIKVTSLAKSQQTASDMAKSLEQILLDDKPTLVIWQTGTVDAIRGVTPEQFQVTLEDGVGTLQAGGADVILMNAQYSPRTESMIAIGAYLDSMRWVSQERGVPLFDRFAIMRHWSDVGAFDLHSATRDITMARQVHDCIGRALAAQVIDAAHLESIETRAGQ
jgi:hypothetical protein